MGNGENAGIDVFTGTVGVQNFEPLPSQQNFESIQHQRQHHTYQKITFRNIFCEIKWIIFGG
jgi:hypothetical protein